MKYLRRLLFVSRTNMTPKILARYRYRVATPVIGCLIGSGVLQGSALAGQTPKSSSRQAGIPAPRAQSPSQRSFDVATRITLVAKDSTILYLLHEIARQANVRSVYDNTAPILKKRITVSLKNYKVMDAFASVLHATGLTARLASDGQTIMIGASSDTTQHADNVRQSGIVAGRVVDSASGKGLARVTMGVVGIKSVTVTNENGTFVLRDIPVGKHTITAKSFGYQSSTRPVTVVPGKTVSVQFRMTPTTTELSGVVTTATGLQRRLEVGNDITTINVDSVVKVMPVSSFTDLLATRVPGLYAAPTSGAPGAPTRIRIRGVKSLNGSNDPIVFVDGVQVYAVQRGSDGDLRDRSTNLVSPSSLVPSPLDQIDPNSIETVEVLKGPSAVALYGSDAANGVIVVTTKHGRAGPTQWNVSANWGTQTLPGTWPTNYWMWGHNYYDESSAVQCGQPYRRPTGCIADSLVTYQILNDPATTAFGRGLAQTYSGGVSGGTNVVRYALTGTITNTLGYVKLPNVDAQILTDARLDVPAWLRRPQSDDQETGTATITVNPRPSTDVTFTTTLGRRFTATTPLDQAITKAASFPLVPEVIGPDGQPVPQGSGLLTAIPDYRKRITERSLHSLNSVNILSRLPRNITTQFIAGIDVTNRTDIASLGNGDCFIVTNSCRNDGSYDTGLGSALQSNAKVTATLLSSLGRFVSLQYAVGGDLLRTTTNDVVRTTRGLPAGATSGNGAETVGGQELSGDRITAGVYAKLTVGIAGRYYIPLEIRRDAGSALGSKSTPSFPGISLSYLISDQPGFHRIPLLGTASEFRVRGSYGQSGKQPTVGAAIRTYLEESSVLNGTSINVLHLAGFGNPDLKPERSREFEGGFDANWWTDRIEIGVTWTRTSTSGLLVSDNIPPSVGGGGSRQINLGDVLNTGIEASLGTTIFEMPSITWRSDVGITVHRNKLVRLGSQYKNAIGGGGGTPGQAVRGLHRVGYPLYGVFVTPMIGYSDRNHDGRITEDEVLLSDSAVYAGASDPKFTANFQETVTLLRRLTIGATIAYQNGLTQQGVPQSGGIYSHAYNDPSASLAEQAYFLNDGTTASVQTVSTLRFDALSIGVIFPRNFLQAVFPNRTVQVSIQGRNLKLWTNYRGKDPNVNRKIGEDMYDGGTLPTPRTWGLKVAIN